MVTLKVGDQNSDFMVDTGAELLVVAKPVAPLSKKTTAVMGIRRRDDYIVLPAQKMSDGGHQVIHEFLYTPECPVPLLGRDLLSKLRAQVTFSPEERPTFQMGTRTYLLSLNTTPR